MRFDYQILLKSPPLNLPAGSAPGYGYRLSILNSFVFPRLPSQAIFRSVHMCLWCFWPTFANLRNFLK